jgi:hypothetical protein
VFPAIIAWVFFRTSKIGWLKAYFIMLLTMLIDLDHLLANPIFDPNRCSVGFHPLHSYFIIPFYSVFLYFPKTRLIGIGLLLHIATDLIDCQFI